jgi:hypothetical protein
MMDPRKIHAAKTPMQKRAYVEALRVPTPANPTYRKHVEKTTDAVEEAEVTEASATQPSMRRYKRDSHFSLRDTLIGVIATVVGGLLLYFVIDVSRGLAGLEERTAEMNRQMESIRADLRARDAKLQELQVEVQVLGRILESQKK